jgi:hypothetical protein
MENDTVNASRVAPPVLVHSNDTYELEVNEMLYTVTTVRTAVGSDSTVFTSVSFTVLGSVGYITFSEQLAVTGGHNRETLVTEYPIARHTLAGLIAGSIAFDYATAVEYDRTH